MSSTPTNMPPPLFNEIQIRAKCTHAHTHEFCMECDNTEYINRWVKIDDLLKHITMDNVVVNLQWHNPIIVE
jgi:hypothetical protein